MRKINILSFLILLTLISCEGTDINKEAPEKEIGLFLNPFIAGTEQKTSTRVAMGTILPDSTLKRVSVCVLSDEQAGGGPVYTQWYHNLGYNNILMRNMAYYHPHHQEYDSATGEIIYKYWYYKPYGCEERENSGIGLFPGKKPVIIYGVHPYMDNFQDYVSDLTKIPFEIGTTDDTNHDYMYTIPVKVDPTNIVAGTKVEKDIQFYHVMTSLEFQMTNTHVGVVTVDSISFKTNDASKIFGRKGTFDATGSSPYATGVVSVDPTSYTDNITIEYKKNIAYKYEEKFYNRYTPYSLIVPAIGHSAGRKINATIYYRYIGDDDIDLVGQSTTVVIDFDKVKTETVNKGFAAGYRYVYKLEIDNFIKYEGYPEIEKWVVPNESNPDDDQTNDIIL